LTLRDLRLEEIMELEDEGKDIAAVAMASLVKMVGLLCAELTVGSHNDDFDLIENCVRAKLHASVRGVSPEATAAGVAVAHRLVEPVLRDLRARVEAGGAAKAAAASPPRDGRLQ
jgi:hypothetical protein